MEEKEPDEVLAKIDALENEINSLEDEYMNIVEPCSNKECAYWDKHASCSCRWTIKITLCKDYRNNRTD